VDAHLSAIVAEIRTLISDWYPAAGPGAETEIDVESDDRRALNRVVTLGVRSGGRRIARLIVKLTPADAPAAAASDDRPRLVTMTPPAARPAFEFDALALLRERLADVGDPRFVPIRPLAILEGSGALVMESFPGRPLHRLLLPRIGPRPAELRRAAVVASAGRWLRILHDTPTAADRPARQQTPGELSASFRAFADFLAANDAKADFGEILAIALAAVPAVRDLEPVLTHGDFAPRNILVDERGRMAVIDLLGRWRAPRYEDVAAFLLSLRTSRLNATTQGLLLGREFDRLEPVFLAAYFGSEPVDLLGVRVYELLLLLDKWSARIVRRKNGAGREQLEGLIDRYFATRSRELSGFIAGEI
jgi:aminoglycoside phosphotransferase